MRLVAEKRALKPGATSRESFTRTSGGKKALSAGAYRSGGIESIGERKFAACARAWTPESVRPLPWRGTSPFSSRLRAFSTSPWTVRTPPSFESCLCQPQKSVPS